MGRRFRQLLRQHIAAERGVPLADVVIVALETFPRNRWGHTGYVEVTYSPGQVWRAGYGFDTLANVSCYID